MTQDDVDVVADVVSQDAVEHLQTALSLFAGGNVGVDSERPDGPVAGLVGDPAEKKLTEAVGGPAAHLAAGALPGRGLPVEFPSCLVLALGEDVLVDRVADHFLRVVAEYLGERVVDRPDHRAVVVIEFRLDDGVGEVVEQVREAVALGFEQFAGLGEFAPVADDPDRPGERAVGGEQRHLQFGRPGLSVRAHEFRLDALARVGVAFLAELVDDPFDGRDLRGREEVRQRGADERLAVAAQPVGQRVGHQREPPRGVPDVHHVLDVLDDRPVAQQVLLAVGTLQGDRGYRGQHLGHRDGCFLEPNGVGRLQRHDAVLAQGYMDRVRRVADLADRVARAERLAAGERPSGPALAHGGGRPIDDRRVVAPASGRDQRVALLVVETHHGAVVAERVDHPLGDDPGYLLAALCGHERL